jgi:hypothetical protein
MEDCRLEIGTEALPLMLLSQENASWHARRQRVQRRRLGSLDWRHSELIRHVP